MGFIRSYRSSFLHLAILFVLFPQLVSGGELASPRISPQSENACKPVQPGSLAKLAVSCGPAALAQATILAEGAAVKTLSSANAGRVLRMTPRILGGLSAIGLPISVLALTNLTIQAMQKEAECFRNNTYKKSLVEKINLDSELIRKAYENTDLNKKRNFAVTSLSPIEIREMTMPDSYLKEEVLEKLPCSHLNDLIAKKTEAQNLRFGKLKANGLLDKDPRQAELTAEDQSMLKELVANFQCSSTQARVEIACAVYSLVYLPRALNRPGGSGAQAERLFGRKLDHSQKDAIEASHLVGQGQMGLREGTFAGRGNYTPEQLREKAEILKAAGFNTEERRKLMEAGVVGTQASHIPGLAPPISRPPSSDDYLFPPAIKPDEMMKSMRTNGLVPFASGNEGKLFFKSLPGGKPEVEKQFFSKMNQKPDAEAAKRNYAELAKMKRYSDEGLLPGLEVVKPTLNGHIMHMSYIPGKSVRDVIRDTSVSPAVRAEVTKRYNDMVDEVFKVWKGRGVKISTSNIQGVRFLYVSGRNNREMVTIDPYNILVDARTLRLFMIDPY